MRPAGTGFARGSTIGTILGADLRTALKVGQGVEVAVGDEHHVSPAAAVSPIGAPHADKFFSPITHGPIASRPGSDGNGGLVDEGLGVLHGWLSLGGGGKASAEGLPEGPLSRLRERNPGDQDSAEAEEGKKVLEATEKPLGNETRSPGPVEGSDRALIEGGWLIEPGRQSAD